MGGDAGGGGRLSSVITSVANFSTQYNFQSIAVALAFMSATVCTSNDDNCKQGIQATWVDSFSSAAVFLGAIIGQLTLGYLGDFFSRSYALMITMLITAISALLSAVTSIDSKNPDTIYALVIFFRFTLGIGAGGVFPLSATKAAEDASHTKGKVNSTASSWSFFWQMPGLVAPWFVGYLLTDSDLSTHERWRFVLAIGCVPAFVCVALLWIENELARKPKNTFDNSNRTAQSFETIFAGFSTNLFSPGNNNTNTKSNKNHKQSTATHNNGSNNNNANLNNNDASHHHALNISSIPMNTTDSSANLQAAGHQQLTYAEVVRLIRQDPRIRSKLIASGGTWFLFNIVVYGLGLLAGSIISALNTDDDNISSNHSIRLICSKQMIALSLSTPATFFSILLLPYVGIKNLQLIGFACICICMFFLAVFFYPLKESNVEELFALYCICIMSLNIGMGVTSFTLPAALFPKRIRATFNGLAAAIGKVGAFIGAFSFHIISENIGFSMVTGICSFVAFLGFMVTYFFIHSKDILTEDTHESNFLLASSVKNNPNVAASEDDGNDLDYDNLSPNGGAKTDMETPSKQRNPSANENSISMSLFTKSGVSSTPAKSAPATPVATPAATTPASNPTAKYRLDTASFFMDNNDGNDDYISGAIMNPILTKPEEEEDGDDLA